MMITTMPKRNPSLTNRKRIYLKNHYPVAHPNLNHKKMQVKKKVANRMIKSLPQMLHDGIHSQQNHKPRMLRKVKIKRWRSMKARIIKLRSMYRNE